MRSLTVLSLPLQLVFPARGSTKVVGLNVKTLNDVTSTDIVSTIEWRSIIICKHNARWLDVSWLKASAVNPFQKNI